MKTPSTYNQMVDLLLTFMFERQKVYLRKEANKAKPWTSDKILQQYRFCNIYREQDRVTKWIANNWREPNEADPDLWFAMVIARYINLPSTLKTLKYPAPWNANKFEDTVVDIMKRNQKVFNSAYIIPTGGTKNTGPKYKTLSAFFTRLWNQRKELRPKGHTLASYATLLIAQPGFGSFMAGQVIADLKYAPPLNDADDWWKFAVSGPGSRRGLNRICCQPVTQNWKEEQWFTELDKLRRLVNKTIKAGVSMSPLHGQDMQNSLCEFDKYCRVLFNEGRTPKQKYFGAL